jgi:hypothetical protein
MESFALRRQFALTIVAVTAVIICVWLTRDLGTVLPGRIVIAPPEINDHSDAQISNAKGETSAELQLQTAVAILEAEEALGPEARSGATLRFGGARYVVISQPSASGVTDILVDLQDRRSTAVVPAGSYSFTTAYGTAVYIEPKKISAYRQDWPSLAVVSGSELGPYTSYASEEGAALTPAETHTDQSISISFFRDLNVNTDESSVTDAGTGKPQKVGVLTLALP